jgi:hypothetical protein
MSGIKLILRPKGDKKAQVFSVDILFAILPIMMILGASLQYLYLAEENLKEIDVNTELDASAQILAEFTINRLYYGQSGSNVHVSETDCEDLEQILGNYTWLGPKDAYYVYAKSFTKDPDNNSLCHPPLQGGIIPNNATLWGNCENNHSADSCCTGADEIECYYLLSVLPDTTGSQQRFVLEYNDTGAPMPGHIAGVNFIRWKNIH